MLNCGSRPTMPAISAGCSNALLPTPLSNGSPAVPATGASARQTGRRPVTSKKPVPPAGRRPLFERGIGQNDRLNVSRPGDYDLDRNPSGRANWPREPQQPSWREAASLRCDSLWLVQWTFGRSIPVLLVGPKTRLGDPVNLRFCLLICREKVLKIGFPQDKQSAVSESD